MAETVRVAQVLVELAAVVAPLVLAAQREPVVVGPALPVQRVVAAVVVASAMIAVQQAAESVVLVVGATHLHFVAAAPSYCDHNRCNTPSGRYSPHYNKDSAYPASPSIVCI